jgi:hypothetical protein
MWTWPYSPLNPSASFGVVHKATSLTVTFDRPFEGPMSATERSRRVLLLLLLRSCQHRSEPAGG